MSIIQEHNDNCVVERLIQLRTSKAPHSAQDERECAQYGVNPMWAATKAAQRMKVGIWSNRYNPTVSIKHV